MNIKNVNKDGENKSVMVFRKDSENKTFYQIGLSRKVAKDGGETWENGYIMAQFNKGTDLANQSKIYLENAILDFYINNMGRTVPFIRVFDYKLEDMENDDKNLPF